MKTFREIAEMHYASAPNNEADKQYRLNRINSLEKLLTEQLHIYDVSNNEVAVCNCTKPQPCSEDDVRSWCFICGKDIAN